MGTLTIGRVGLDVELTTVPEMAGISQAASDGRSTLSLSGPVYGASFAETVALREELISQTEYMDGRVVPVTYSKDSSLDGFYRVKSANIDMRNSVGAGLGMLSAVLERVGSPGDMLFQSRVTTALRTNSRSVTSSAALLKFTYGTINFMKPSIAVVASSGGLNTHPPGDPTSTSSGGTVGILSNTVATGTPVSSALDPYFQIAPADFYKAGCEVWTGGYLRGGTRTPNTPNNFSLSNGLIRIGRASEVDSRFSIENWYPGAGWESETEWEIIQSGPNDITWTSLAITHCDPWLSSVRLGGWITNQNDVAILDLTVRRGIPIIYGRITIGSTQTHLCATSLGGWFHSRNRRHLPNNSGRTRHPMGIDVCRLWSYFQHYLRLCVGDRNRLRLRYRSGHTRVLRASLTKPTLINTYYGLVTEDVKARTI